MGVYVTNGLKRFGYVTDIKIGGFFSPSSRHILCGSHTRKMRLQPTIRSDVGAINDCDEKAADCPFCPGGPLYRKYSQYRSQKSFMAKLGQLEAELRMDEQGLRETILTDVVNAATSDGDAYRDRRNAARAVHSAVEFLVKNAILHSTPKILNIVSKNIVLHFEVKENTFYPEMLNIVSPQAIEQVAEYWSLDN